jgi:hypothetical protein
MAYIFKAVWTVVMNKDFNVTALRVVIPLQNGGNLLTYSETSINFYYPTRRHIPKDGKLHCNRREKIKSRIKILTISLYYLYGDYRRRFVSRRNNG